MLAYVLIFYFSIQINAELQLLMYVSCFSYVAVIYRYYTKMIRRRFWTFINTLQKYRTVPNFLQTTQRKRFFTLSSSTEFKVRYQMKIGFINCIIIYYIVQINGPMFIVLSPPLTTRLNYLFFKKTLWLRIGAPTLFTTL